MNEMKRFDDGNVLVAAPASDVRQLSPEYREAFRRVVEHALRYIFEESEAAAFERVQAYFADEDLSLFAYHRNPLQIATDLSEASERPLNKVERAHYLELVKSEPDSFGLPPHAHSADGPEFGWTSSP